jgi:Lon protease-like protein
MVEKEKNKKLIEENIMPILPVSNLVMLPGVRVPILIIEEKYKKMVFDTVSSSGFVGIFSVKQSFFRQRERELKAQDFFPIGCAGKIVSFSEAMREGYSVLIEGIFRVKLVEVIQDEPYDKVKFEILPDILPPEDEQERLKSAIIEKAVLFLRKIGEDPARIRDIVQFASAMRFEEVVNWAVFLHPLKFNTKLSLLEENRVEERAKKLIEEIKRDVLYLDLLEVFRPLKPKDPRVN